MMKISLKIFTLVMLLFVLFGCMTPAGTADPNGSGNPAWDSAPSEETAPRATPTVLAGDAGPGPGTTPTPVPPTPTATVVVPTAVTPYPDGEFWILPEGPLAPTDFGDALRQRIEAGDVATESGIIAGLDYLLGTGDTAIFGALTPAISIPRDQPHRRFTQHSLL
ncbi:MAG: hypothetical protein HUU38_09165 [Anaerolineales bacterium]|nr:hypothetical protein [Anaerolineales bacterium]